MPAVLPRKRVLRAEVRAQRAAMTPTALRTAESGIAQQLDALVAAAGVRTVSCYLSLGAEPGTWTFVRDAAARGIRVILPRSLPGGLLEWGELRDIDALTTGMFGIAEPAGTADAALSDADLVLIPAAAADRRGVRLGWGRGYFDRALAALPPQTPVYAVIYDAEVLESLPREAHDQPVTGIVTPTQTITLSLPRP